MIHNHINDLAKVRTVAEVSLDNLALISNVNPSVLLDMESGKQRPSLRVIAMYHLLFDASYKTLFSDLCADLNTYLTERSSELISALKKSKSPKSNYRLQSILKIVKLLNPQDYHDID